MNRVRILPYKMGSQGSKSLSEALKAQGVDCLRVYSDGDYKPRTDDLIVLWGHGWKPEWWNLTAKHRVRILNHPESIEIAVHKADSFKALEGKVRIPAWTTASSTAARWHEQGASVCARSTVEGMDGRGLTLVQPNDELERHAPLYTVFVPSVAEYRIHVFDGTPIIWQKKGTPPDADGVADKNIRTEANGWAFLKTKIGDVPDDVFEQSILAVKALGLDFGGVDVLWTGHEAVVLEVNTAPAIAGTDITAYCSAILKLMEE